MLFVFTSVYLRPANSAEFERHAEWLKAQDATGRLLAAGRKSTRDGGVVVLEADDEAAARAVVDLDPFVLAGVAEYNLTSFKPAMGRLARPA